VSQQQVALFIILEQSEIGVEITTLLDPAELVHTRFVGIENIPYDKPPLHTPFRVLPGQIIDAELSKCGLFATITTCNTHNVPTNLQAHTTYLLEVTPLLQLKRLVGFVSHPHLPARELAIWRKLDSPRLTGGFAILPRHRHDLEGHTVKTHRINDTQLQTLTALVCNKATLAKPIEMPLPGSVPDW